MKKIGQREILILIVALIAGFALRFYTFEQKSLWIDEIYTFNEAKYGPKGKLKFYEEKPYHLDPPLFFCSYPFPLPI